MEFRGRTRIYQRINLAPLIDVVFLLLIFFLLTSSFALKTGINLDLPRTKHAMQTFVESPLEIFVNRDAEIIMDNSIIARDRFLGHLSGIIKEKPDKKIFFYADRNCRYEDVCQILDDIKKSQAKGVVLRTEKQ